MSDFDELFSSLVDLIEEEKENKKRQDEIRKQIQDEVRLNGRYEARGYAANWIPEGDPGEKFTRQSLVKAGADPELLKKASVPTKGRAAYMVVGPVKKDKDGFEVTGA